MEMKKAVRALKASLEASGRIMLLPRIAKSFSRHAERELRRTRVTLTIANKGGESAAKKSARAIVGKDLSEDVHIAIDNTLIGGWRLEGNGQLIDASFKKHLLEMCGRITNSIPRRSDEVGGRGPDLASGYNRATRS